MSLITGDFNIVDPDGMDNQMAIEHITYTTNHNILLWSSYEYFIYNIEGQLLHRENLDKALNILYKTNAENLVNLNKIF